MWWVLGGVLGVFFLGIASAILIPVFLNQGDAGVRASVRSDLRNAATAAETVLIVTGAYPVTVGELETAAFRQGSDAVFEVWSAGGVGYCIQGTTNEYVGHYASASGLGDGPCP